MTIPIDEQLARITASTDLVTPLDALREKLASGRRLRIKLGLDPTAPDLHLGHAVVLEKLRDFQELGHQVIFLIGDYTARIGDPSGKSKTRPPLSGEEIDRNAKTYFTQVSRILDPELTEIRYNGEWLSRLDFASLLRLTSMVTVARVIEREDFQKRLAAHAPISFHELLYPLMQGYDSVALHADVELGGSDQTFNLLMGRHLQEQFGSEPQVVITMPLLEGLDGIAKMSKSLGNYVGLFEDAAAAYGKLMSISDELMWRYYTILLRMPEADVARMRACVADGSLHPMKLKKELAHAIISRYWSAADATRGQEVFESVFERRDYSDVESIVLSHHLPSSCWIIDLLKHAGAITSSSEGKRLIESRAVTLDNEIIVSFDAHVAWHDGSLLKVGKRRICRLIRET